MALGLEQANCIVDAALAEGKRRGAAPLCVVVLDAGAHPIVLKRDDGASISRPEIATAKAAGCLGLGFGGREVHRRASASPAFYASLTALFPRGLVPNPGGVLIRDAAGVIIGAVGITGDTADTDEACAVAGIRAAGLVPDAGGS